MKDWKKSLIPPTCSILDSIRAINDSGIQIALVVDQEQRLIGSVTDGDIRRAILKQVSIDASVQEVMCPKPEVATVRHSRRDIATMMNAKKLRAIPIIDDEKRVIGIETLGEITSTTGEDNPVVIMVGGQGSRLRPMTESAPKPLLKVGKKPVLETILENFIDFGFKHFYFAVHYKADMIIDHFKDGRKWKVDIQYLTEEEPMGTAGALSLLPEKPDIPFIVMNGDLLTKLNFCSLIDYHIEYNAKATMCVREFDLQIPYGIAHAEGTQLTHIEEKPVQQFLTNAGIYVFDPCVLDIIPENKSLDMPELFHKMLEMKWNSVIFPIREYWIDIGVPDELKRAICEYSNEFSEK